MYRKTIALLFLFLSVLFYGCSSPGNGDAENIAAGIGPDEEKAFFAYTGVRYVFSSDNERKSYYEELCRDYLSLFESSGDSAGGVLLSENTIAAISSSRSFNLRLDWTRLRFPSEMKYEDYTFIKRIIRGSELIKENIGLLQEREKFLDACYDGMTRKDNEYLKNLIAYNEGLINAFESNHREILEIHSEYLDSGERLEDIAAGFGKFFGHREFDSLEKVSFERIVAVLYLRFPEYIVSYDTEGETAEPVSEADAVNSLKIPRASGYVSSCDREGIEQFIGEFNEQWVSYVNSGDDSYREKLIEQGPLDRRLAEFDRNGLQEVLDYTMVSDIECTEDGRKAAVSVREGYTVAGQGKTVQKEYYWIYSIQWEKGEWKIYDSLRIE